MKKVYILAILCLASNLFLKGQQKDRIFPEGCTLEEAKEVLDSGLKQIEMLRFISNLSQSKLSIGNNSIELEPTENTIEFSKNNLPKDSIEAHLKEYLANVYFTQDLAQPYSSIRLLYELNLLGRSIDPKIEARILKRPKLVLKKIYYADGTSEKLDIPSDQIGNMKQISKVDAIVNMDYPMQYEAYRLSEEHKSVDINGDTVYLTNIADRSINLMFPTDSVLGEITKVVGVTDKDVFIHSTSSSYGPANDGAMSKILDQVEQMYTYYLEELNQGRVTSVSQIEESIQATILPLVQKIESKGTKASYGFPWEVKEIYLQRPIYRTISIAVSLEKNPDEEKGRLWIAKDSDKNLTGLVNQAGNWKISPDYKFLEHFVGKFYNGGSDERPNEMSYVYEPATNTLKPNEFMFIQTLEDYILIQDAQEKNGIIDSKSANMIIPPQYDKIRDYIDDGVFVCERNIDSLRQDIEVYNLKGELAIPGKFSVINLGANNTLETVLFQEGMVYLASYKLGTFEKLASESMRDSEYMGSRYLFLTFDYQEQKYNYENIQGTKIIRGNHEYDFIEETFIGQRALVIKGLEGSESALYTYINVKGELTFPFIYNKAIPFKGKYTYVEKESVPMLIDKDHKVLKELPAKINTDKYIVSGKLDKGLIILNNGLEISVEDGETVSLGGVPVVVSDKVAE